MVNSQSVAQRIRYYRNIAQLSQTELAQLTGLTQATISHYEKGNTKPTTAQLELITVALNEKLATMSPGLVPVNLLQDTQMTGSESLDKVIDGIASINKRLDNLLVNSL
ncbi:MAG: helix-turn-helix transcriptional regulator [Acidaminococcaceae bacterium]|nr:helix-turn-helix transcriptional regulator [Acidaminococcaceae bacterium]MBR1589550.1 helix-turn-helix transcriptional regulator [Acidaminococcaceae bacterium]